MYDVIIIGAGIVGCAVARELSQYKLNTLVLEKMDDVGAGGASKANTAIVHAGFDALENSNKAKYNVLGNAMYENLCNELDVPFKRNSSLVVAFKGDDISGLHSLKERGERNNVPNLSIINHDELRKIEPNISSDAVAALVAPTGGIVCPFRITIAMAENAYNNGVNFKFNSHVNDINKHDSHYNIILDDGLQYQTKVIINCAGVDSARLNNMVSENKFNILPRRGEYYLLDKSLNNTFNSTIFQLPSDKGKGIVVTQTIDGNLLLGPTANDLPPDQAEDTKTTSEGLQETLNGAFRTWPKIPLNKAITNFSGIRARSSTGDFVIGECIDADGFFNAAGIESPGLSAAPAIGQELAHQVSKKLNAQLNKKYNPIRKGIISFNESSIEEKNELIKNDPLYGNIVCRCETISESEIRQAIRRPLGARNIDALKRRVRPGAGRCQGGFCTPKMIEILSQELNIDPCDVTKFGKKSNLLTGVIGQE